MTKISEKFRPRKRKISQLNYAPAPDNISFSGNKVDYVELKLDSPAYTLVELANTEKEELLEINPEEIPDFIDKLTEQRNDLANQLAAKNARISYLLKHIELLQNHIKTLQEQNIVT